MNMQQQYRRDLREKLRSLGEVVSETDTQFSVKVQATPEEAHRRVVTLMPSAVDIKASQIEEGTLVEVQFAGVSTLNE